MLKWPIRIMPLCGAGWKPDSMSIELELNNLNNKRAL